jgi:hypothetical protein
MPSKPTSPAKVGRVDVKRALNLALSGTSYANIARIMGVTTSAVHQQIKPLMELIGDPTTLRAYQMNKADALEGIQAQLARSLLDKDKLRKANLGNVAYAMRQLNDMLRLERGESTANVAVAHTEAIKTLQEVEQEIASITEEIPERVAGPPDPTVYKDDPKLKRLDEELERLSSQGVDIPEDTGGRGEDG